MFWNTPGIALAFIQELNQENLQELPMELLDKIPNDLLKKLSKEVLEIFPIAVGMPNGSISKEFLVEFPIKVLNLEESLMQLLKELKLMELIEEIPMKHIE